MKRAAFIFALNLSITLLFIDHSFYCVAQEGDPSPNDLTELFDNNDFDLENTTLTFIPNGSSSFYDRCLEPVDGFPINPNEGTQISLEDDEFHEITLENEKTLTFFGINYSSFFVSSNGYISISAKDSTEFFPGYDLQTYFSLPRISGLYHDLDPSSGGIVSWVQLSDRVVVTFKDVPSFGEENSNNFQINLFFNGTISLTYLAIDSNEMSHWMGLSQGQETPENFVEADLSASEICIDDMGLIVLDATTYACNTTVILKVSDRNASESSLSIEVKTESGDTETIVVSDQEGDDIYSGAIDIAAVNEDISVGDGLIQGHPTEKITFTYKDSDNGNSLSQSIVSSAKLDCEPPAIVVEPPELTIECGNEAVNFLEGISVIDNSTVDISNIIFSGSIVDKPMIGDSIVSYNVTDAAGNVALEQGRLYHVEDTREPVIKVDPIKTIVLVGSDIADSILNGVSAFDDCDGDVTANIFVEGAMDANTVADYTILYGVVDSSGKAAQKQTRVYRVINKTIFVDTDAKGENDGTSWNNAYSSLQTAISHSVNGNEIWVAEGIYRPTQRIDPDDARSATFLLKNGVGIYGGFKGNETQRNQRDWQINKTTLNGDIDEDDDSDCNLSNLSRDKNKDGGPNCKNHENNVYHVVTGAAVNESAVIDGFTISGGFADDGTEPGTPSCDYNGLRNFGGGMLNHVDCLGLNQPTNSTVRNCTFTGNYANDNGGGMCNIYYASPTVENCLFIGNSAGSVGGGMVNNWFCDATVTNCIFVNNSAGGMGISGFSDAIINDCKFIGNISGGLGVNAGSSPTLNRCLFMHNTGSKGGGMQDTGGVGGGEPPYASSPIVTDCTFYNNAADQGGGSFSASFPTFIDCVFSNNSATDEGGGIRGGGQKLLSISSIVQNDLDDLDNGVVPDVLHSRLTSLFGNLKDRNATVDVLTAGSLWLVDYSWTLHFVGNTHRIPGVFTFEYEDRALSIFIDRKNSRSITDSIFTNNSAGLGGGFINYDKWNVSGSKFTNNSADSNGGAIHTPVNSSLTLTNCTLRGNAAIAEGGAIFNSSSKSSTITNSIFGENFDSSGSENTAQIANSDSIQLSSSVIQNWSNPGGNNIIVSPPELTVDGHLKKGSPAIETGDSINSLLRDIDKEDRPHGISVDMGIDEFIDIDGDGLPDWLEGHVSGNTTGLAPHQDLDHDGLTNLQEYELSTNPANPDTDLDGLKDGEEIFWDDDLIDYRAVSDPRHPDTIISPFKDDSRFESLDLERMLQSVRHSVIDDMDSDGDLDIIYSLFTGELWYYSNSGTVVSPSWERPAKPIRDDVFQSFGVGDQDGDGDLDIIFLAETKLVTINNNYIENSGVIGWGEPVVVELGVEFPSGNTPHLADADNDTDLDIIVDNDGQLVRIENIGDSSTPVWGFPDPLWAGTTVFLPSLASTGDIELDGDLDRFIGLSIDDNSPVFQRNINEHLLIFPQYLTIVQGESQQLEVEGDHGEVTFSLAQNTSGGSISPEGLYIAGLDSIGVDVIQAVAEDGLSGVVAVNVISEQDADRKAKVLIVVGTRSVEDSLFATSERLAMDVYVVCRQRGYRASDICLLTPNGTLSKSTHLGYSIAAADDNGQLETAIKDWAKDVDDLILYFVDHGVVREGKGNLVLRPGEYLTSETLKTWLGDWQTQKAERTSLVIIDTCYSGHFVEELSLGSPQRIVMAASEPGALAHFQGNGAISFSQLFWDEIAAGAETHKAFLTTVENLADALDQVPIIDTDGDGVQEKGDDIETIRSIGLGELQRCPGYRSPVFAWGGGQCR